MICSVSIPCRYYFSLYFVDIINVVKRYHNCGKGLGETEEKTHDNKSFSPFALHTPAKETKETEEEQMETYKT